MGHLYTSTASPTLQTVSPLIAPTYLPARITEFPPSPFCTSPTHPAPSSLSLGSPLLNSHAPRASCQLRPPHAHTPHQLFCPPTPSGTLLTVLFPLLSSLPPLFPSHFLLTPLAPSAYQPHFVALIPFSPALLFPLTRQREHTTFRLPLFPSRTNPSSPNPCLVSTPLPSLSPYRLYPPSPPLTPLRLSVLPS